METGQQSQVQGTKDGCGYLGSSAACAYSEEEQLRRMLPLAQQGTDKPPPTKSPIMGSLQKSDQVTGTLATDLLPVRDLAIVRAERSAANQMATSSPGKY